ncbi:DUF305 domain-containing protein [Nakamurella sp. GG22]
MIRLARSGAAVLAAAFMTTLAACGTTTDSGSSSGTSASNASTASSAAAQSNGTSSTAMMSTSSSSSSGISSEHNAADLTFAQSMIVHHQGAIEMSDLAATRASSEQVRELAARIKAAQGPEIERMQAWLAAWGAAMTTSSASSSSDDEMGGMDHGGMSGMGTEGPMTGSDGAGMSMPGMMTDEQMQQLTDASGAGFDTMFLQMMIAHHQGAIEMSDTELADGSNPDALALASAIKTSQTAEISEMQQILETL